MSSNDWTPEERRALNDLYDGWDGGAELEERIAASLRREGLTRSGGSPRRQIWIRPWAIAASLAGLIVVSYLTGHHVGSRQTAAAVIAGRESERAETVAAVRQAGATYLAALRDLVEVSAGASSADWARGRSEAVASLRAAADEMVRISPDDPVTAYLIQALDRAGAEDGVESAAASRHVEWF